MRLITLLQVVTLVTAPLPRGKEFWDEVPNQLGSSDGCHLDSDVGSNVLRHDQQEECEISSDSAVGSKVPYNQAEISRGTNTELPGNTFRLKAQLNHPGDSVLESLYRNERKQDNTIDTSKVQNYQPGNLVSNGNENAGTSFLGPEVRNDQETDLGFHGEEMPGNDILRSTVLNGLPEVPISNVVDGIPRDIPSSQEVKKHLSSSSANVPTSIEEKNEEEHTCSICLGDLNQSKNEKWRTCTHSFHVDCVAPWKKEHYRCPICREEDRELPGYTYRETFQKGLLLRINAFYARHNVPRDDFTDFDLKYIIYTEHAWEKFKNSHPSISDDIMKTHDDNSLASHISPNDDSGERTD